MMHLHDLKSSFRDFILNPEYHTLPTLGQLEMHARLLRTQSNIKRSHAKDMVAYYHGYGDWQHLLAGLRHRELPNRRTDIPFINIPEEKQKVVRLIETLPDSVLKRLAGYEPEPNTVLRAILDQRSDHLFEAEISALYSELFADETYEYEPDEVVAAVIFRDNSILSRIKYMCDRSLEVTNPHIYNYRTGWRTYCYINLKDDRTVEISIRELDSFIYPSVRHGLFFMTQWHVSYILSHIQQIMNTLKCAGYSGEIKLHRVNNEGLLEYYTAYGHVGLSRYSCADEPWINEKVDELNIALIEAGACAVSGGKNGEPSVYGHLAFNF